MAMQEVQQATARVTSDRGLYLKARKGEAAGLAKRWSRLKSSSLDFTASGDFVVMSGSPEVFAAFCRFLRVKQCINSRYVHTKEGVNISQAAELASQCCSIFPGVQISHVEETSTLLVGGDAADAFINALKSIEKVCG